MPDIGNAKDCLKLPPTNFSIFTLKNVIWRTYLISCTVRYCFLFRFVSSNLSCNLFLWYYDQLVLFDKEINANLYRHCFWEYSKRFHWRYLSKPVLGGHPVLSGHYSIPRGCPLNTGFTVYEDIIWFIENTAFFFCTKWDLSVLTSSAKVWIEGWHSSLVLNLGAVARKNLPSW